MKDIREKGQSRMILSHFATIMRILGEEAKAWPLPAVESLSKGKDVPYRALVSTLLSLRTKDAVTREASRRLFQKAEQPQAMRRLSTKTIERLIYPVGFYHTKAARLKEISRILIRNYGGRVPDTLEELLRLPGVGRKTANLVIIEGYGKPGICVDIHVHRITNRWGLVETHSPNDTEMRLREILPKRYWMGINGLLVGFGQNICVPVSPFCSRCRLKKFCARRGVSRSR